MFILGTSLLTAVVAASSLVLNLGTLCRESGLRIASNSSKGPHVTDIHSSALLGNPHVFQTSSADGFVRTWDLRTQNSVESYASQHEKSIYSCHCNGTHVAGGVGEDLVLWDRRTRKTAAMFKDTHALDIVQLRFDEMQPNFVVSASEDGNMAVFDLSTAIDEEDSFVGAVSINTSVSRLGLFGLQNERLWCSTGTESLHWWDWKAFCDPMSTSGAGVTSESFNAREAMRIGEQGSDYIIRCHFDPHQSSMYCISGDINGAIGVYPCHDTQGEILFGAHPSEILQGGHTDIVRDAMVIPQDSTFSSLGIVSGGEDGRLCLWTNSASSSSHKHVTKKASFAPY